MNNILEGSVRKSGKRVRITAQLIEVKLDPDSMISQFTMGYSYLWSGKLSEALHVCNSALQTSNRHVWNLNLILIIYLKLNQQDKAFNIFKEIENKYKDHQLPPSNLAMAAAAMGKDETALKLAQSAVDTIDPYFSFIAFKIL